MDASLDAPLEAEGAAPDPIVQVSAGGSVTCFRVASGTVHCAGLNDDNAPPGSILGDGLSSHPGCPVAGVDCSGAPTTVLGLKDVVDVRSGAYHSCARTLAGGVVCWGRNNLGQLGDGTFLPRTGPVEVHGLVGVVQLAVGANVSCARKAAGEVVCWGQNDRGHLGDGTLTDRAVPTSVVGLADAITISVGENGACAVRAGGQVVCWGMNRSGELGDGVVAHSACSLGFDCSTSPVNVYGIADATQVARGSNEACAVRSDGTMWCWGSNTWGQLGDGVQDHGNYPTWQDCQFNDCQPTPVEVVGVTSPKQIVLGAGNACVRRASGVISCWGFGDYAELGVKLPMLPSGPVLARPSPGDVPGISDALSLSGSAHDYCTLRPGGHVTCWGRNLFGELVNGSYSPTFAPTDVAW